MKKALESDLIDKKCKINFLTGKMLNGITGFIENGIKK